MTAHPNDRDWDRLDALVDEDPIALRDTAWRLATALTAAERREEQLLLRNRNLLDASARDVPISKVRRDAAREALDGLAAELMEAARDCALGGDHRGAVAWRNASAHTHHRRDTHYPEETP